MSAETLARRLLEDSDLRRRTMADATLVLGELGLVAETLAGAARHLAGVGGAEADAARAALFALLAAQHTETAAPDPEDHS